MNMLRGATGARQAALLGLGLSMIMIGAIGLIVT